MNDSGGSPVQSASTFTAVDGTHLYYRSLRPAKERAVLVLVHGLGEHSGRYERLSRTLADAGVAVFAFDLRGHGRSPGKRGHVSAFGDFTSDLESFRQVVRREVSEASPIFLFGHSLGGLISIRHLQQYPRVEWAGIILSAPALGIRMQIPDWKRIAGKIIARLAPSMSLDNGIVITDLSRDPAVVAAYRDDPFVHRRISAKLFSDMQSEAVAVAERIPSLRAPAFLWLVPGDDRICDSELSLGAASRLPGSADVVVKRYDGAFHEALNDSCAEEVSEDIRAWMLERSS
ncbi:alpha/beta hydrolase [soil metagenome]